MSYTVYIVSCLESDPTLAYQQAAFSAISEYAGTEEPQIVCVTLEAINDWLPPGYLQAQQLGSLMIVCNYQGEVTDPVKSILNQFHIDVRDAFKSHHLLEGLVQFQADQTDVQLNERLSKAQQQIGIIKYTGICDEVHQINDEINKLTQECVKETSVADVKLRKINAKYRTEIESLSMLTRDSHELNEKKDAKRVECEHSRQQIFIDGERKLGPVKARVNFLKSRMYQLSLFAKTIERGYGFKANRGFSGEQPAVSNQGESSACESLKP